MTDMLIRDVPEDVVASLDEVAQRLGLSRSEVVRRELAGFAARHRGPVTTDDLMEMSELAQDLGDPDVMRGAWA